MAFKAKLSPLPKMKNPVILLLRLQVVRVCKGYSLNRKDKVDDKGCLK